MPLQIARRVVCCAALVFTILPQTDAAEPKKDASELTLSRIYGSEFQSKTPSVRWLEDSAGYTQLESSKSRAGARDIVRHDAETGRKDVMVSAEDLVPNLESGPLSIQGYTFSSDLSKVLIYTNSKRVWRTNTRGDYWLLDRGNGQLTQLGKFARPSSLMFAKLSPDGLHAAYVYERNIYLENLLDGKVRQLTQTPSEHIINGTFDWVYEEELGLRDGFRFSPDGQSIAYWQLDTTGVSQVPLVNNTDSFYPKITWIPYPKTGQRNSACRVGVVSLDTGQTRWVLLPGDDRNHYIARMEWAENPDELVIQQLNRKQNTNRVMLVDTTRNVMTPKVILTETDETWVDIHDDMHWIEDGKRFTWMSERDGWNHAYLVSRDGSKITLATPGEFDTIQLLHVDEATQSLYYIASPKNPAQRYLFRAKWDGSETTRLTPEEYKGSNSYRISSDGQWAVHTHSSADSPPQTRLIKLPSHETHRELELNKPLREKLAKLRRTTTEFFYATAAPGVEMHGWCLKPADLDPEKKYPLLIYVYGEPAGTTVTDRWGGSSGLWHRMLAQQGYIVISMDNQGTKAPRGREWRKAAYRKIGVVSPVQQAAGLEDFLKKRPYIDRDRIGIWGWSGGGSSTLQALFKYPDLYKMGIAIAPVPNQRYYDTIYQERYMGLPRENIEGFREGGAINFAHQLKGDLLLIHGTGDDNCHYQTTELLINRLIEHNKQFRMFAYPNRTHSIREGKNTTRHLRKMMTDFVYEKLPRNPDSSMPDSKAAKETAADENSETQKTSDPS